MKNIKVEQTGGSGFFIWVAGWLFTIGYLQLTLGPSLLAIFIWPYYLGASFV